MASAVTALRHAAEMLRYAATRSDHDRRDAETASELTVSSYALDLPPGLELTWLGVAGFALSYENTTILFDPYVTRVGTREMWSRRALTADREQIDRWVPRADAILLGHTHFDHAMDAPAIARRDGATVYGGTSAETLMNLHGLGHLSSVVEAHRPIEIGPFTVTFVPSLHSKLVLGAKVNQGGELTCDHVDGLTSTAFCCGQVYGIHVEVAGTTLYHQGSADLLDDEIRHRDIDLFLCGIAGRNFTDDYVGRILRRLQPKRIVAMHHDDFFRPLGDVQRFAFGVDVTRFPDEVAAFSRNVEVVTLAPPSVPVSGT